MLPAMIESFAARKYLQAALPLGQWAAASHAIGRNHAYIEQYVRRGVPRFLAEDDRRILVKLYGLDEKKLKPPPKSASPPRIRRQRVPVREKGDLEAELNRIFANDPEQAELLRIWARIARYAESHQRRIGLMMLSNFADSFAPSADVVTSEKAMAG
jgi:hypothetical protein